MNETYERSFMKTVVTSLTVIAFLVTVTNIMLLFVIIVNMQ